LKIGSDEKLLEKDEPQDKSSSEKWTKKLYMRPAVLGTWNHRMQLRGDSSQFWESTSTYKEPARPKASQGLWVDWTDSTF